MDAFVVTLTQGCCASYPESGILGIFLSVEQANLHIKDDTLFGGDVQFTTGTQVIDLADKFAGYLSISIHRQMLADPSYEQKKLRDLMAWLSDEPTIEQESDQIVTRLVQHFPDTVGLEFSGYIITLTDDGHWFIEANDGG